MSYESCIHYKFVNTTTYSAIKFEGLEISLFDLKMKILLAKHMNHAPLEVINAQNKKPYVEEAEMIPRNTSVIVKRIPPPQTNHSSKVIIANQKRRAEKEIADRIKLTTTEIGNQQADLYKIEESEDYIFKTMMQQATFGFDLSSKNSGKVFNATKCYACGQYGHQKDKCPLYFKDSNMEFPRKRPKGIPSTMLEIIPGEKIDNIKMREGVYINRKGDYCIPIVDKLAMEKGQTRNIKLDLPVADSLQYVPTEIQCKLCQRILFDAVKVQCCNNNFCDECIRNYIINNNFNCPLQECGKGDILPDNLVPNRALRKAVKQFHANIASEKYNSHPKIVHPSCDNKISSDLENRNGNSLQDLTPETSHDRCQVLKTSGNFLPIHLKNTCSDNSTPIAQCEVLSEGSFSELSPQLEPSRSSQFLCIPFLSEKEFYNQQAIYRRKQQSKDSNCTDFKEPNYSNTSTIPVNSEQVALSAVHKIGDCNLSSEVFNISNADLPSSIRVLEGVSSNNVAICPNQSQLPVSNSPKVIPTIKDILPSVDIEIDEDAISRSIVDKYHERVSDGVFPPHNDFVSPHQTNAEISFGKVFFDSYSSDVHNSKVLDEHSVLLTRKSSPQNPITDHFSTTVKPVINYENYPDDQSDCDWSNNNSAHYHIQRNECTSIATQPYHSNTQLDANIFYIKDVASDSYQSRLQSTVKKVLPTPVVTNSTYSYNHSVSLLTPGNICNSFDSNSQPSLDSTSELEEGQIVSSGSGSHCFDEQIEFPKTHNKLTLSHHKRFPTTRAINVSKIYESHDNLGKSKILNAENLNQKS